MLKMSLLNSLAIFFLQKLWIYKVEVTFLKNSQVLNGSTDLDSGRLKLKIIDWTVELLSGI